MARTGRPKFKPTKPQRERVMRLRADGWSLERIARVMKIDAKTLDKHFAAELEHGADVKTDQLLEYAEKGAKKGSQANIKWLSERYAAARAAEQLESRGRPTPEPESSTTTPPPEVKLGKKEQQREAAHQVTGKFAPPPGPTKATRLH